MIKDVASKKEGAKAIIWFRRDLRLADHAALQAALDAGCAILPLYIHAPDEDGAWRAGAASQAWLHRSLLALDQDLRKLGSSLIVRAGSSATVLREMLAQTGATHVFWHRLYEPHLVTRDTQIKADLRARGALVKSFAGYLLNEPHKIRTAAGEIYRVFTPYWRNASANLLAPAPLPRPQQLSAHGINGLPVDALKLRDTKGWDSGFWQQAKAGEQGAQEALDLFIEGALRHYHDGRNRPDQVGTSRLSAHLHFGEISVGQVIDALTQAKLSTAARAHADFYVRELGWRDFSHQLLHYFPDTAQAPLNHKFTNFPWAKVDELKLKAWQQGKTGIPIVDAGMRELWQTGWMHNRVRMIVASFLTKNLRYHWLEGARWFWHTLVDANLANNTQGWQWTAGCGADAAPYFRIFNPVSQGEKFDPNGDYVRRFVPELSQLSAKQIHAPFEHGGVAGYPAPIVDLKLSRAAALDAFAQLKGL